MVPSPANQLRFVVNFIPWLTLTATFSRCKIFTPSITLVPLAGLCFLIVCSHHARSTFIQLWPKDIPLTFGQCRNLCPLKLIIKSPDQQEIQAIRIRFQTVSLTHEMPQWNKPHETLEESGTSLLSIRFLREVRLLMVQKSDWSTDMTIMISQVVSPDFGAINKFWWATCRRNAEGSQLAGKPSRTHPKKTGNLKI